MKLRIKFLITLIILSLQSCAFLPNSSPSPAVSSDVSFECKLSSSPILDDTPIYSVVIRGQNILASTKAGLFRASLMDKEWSKVVCPDAFPINGRFARGGEDLAEILYHTSDNIYVSADEGHTWSLASSMQGIQSLYLHSNGTLYVITTTEHASNDGKGHLRDYIFESKDFGRTWRDITGEIWPCMSLYGIFENPEHPTSIALHGVCIRGYVLSASDENYDWEFIADWEWKGTEEEFFARRYSVQAQTQAYMLHATLGNYFEHNFGSGSSLPAFDLVTEQVAYKFGADEEKEVEVTVHSLLDNETFRILDAESDLDFWRMRIIDSSGQRILVPKMNISEISSQHQSNVHPQVIEISKSRPYMRTINIDSFYDFAGDGEYKVQLVYYTPSLDDPDSTAWLGSFTSPVFTVTIN